MKRNNASSVNLVKKAREIRKDIIEICYRANVGHIAPALSITDILTVLYFKILRIDPENPFKRDRDRLILSKGHAAAALYATLHHRGFFTKNKLLAFCQNNGSFGVHPDHNIKHGVEVTTGSLGHGLSVGIGMAIALKEKYKHKTNTPRVFVIVSDAELNEGSVWEGVMFASHHKLDNLVLIVDDNGLQAFGKTKEILNLQPIESKLRIFGWETHTVDGHNLNTFSKILEKIPFKNNKPGALVAKTVAGKGVSFMENTLDWHYLSLNNSQYRQAIKELL